MAGLTANPKYNQSPIAQQYREGKLKSTLKRGLKDLKSRSDMMVTALRCCNVRVEKWAKEMTYSGKVNK